MQDCGGMSKHWKEPLDPERHVDHMVSSVGGSPAEAPRDNLIECWVYFVRVCGFTFEFVSVDQIRECLRHFSLKIHPSGRSAEPPPGVHWNHPWHERLPMTLYEERRRVKVEKALRNALDEFE